MNNVSLIVCGISAVALAKSTYDCKNASSFEDRLNSKLEMIFSAVGINVAICFGIAGLIKTMNDK
jgi:hypothetical protein